MWRDETDSVIIRNVMDDLDEHDRTFVELAKDAKQIKTILVGLLLSTTTAAIIGALNLFLGGLAG
jgi:hypothetical protein